MSIAIVDAHYEGERARAAAVVAASFEAATPEHEHVAHLTRVAPYQPGAFYQRELPCLLAVLSTIPRPSVIVIDGYVWLDDRRKGLGAHLSEALLGITVVGIAKTAYRGALAEPVLRGASRVPLFVTAIGMDLAEAAARVRTMHGPHRLPTLVRRADRLARK